MEEKAMTNRPPPIPAENLSPKGPQDVQSGAPLDTSMAKEDVTDNADKRGQTGNIKQNTTNQGHQQDR
jgi:hypothetical protein